MSENAMRQSEQSEQPKSTTSPVQAEPSGPEFDLDYIKKTATTMLMEPVTGWQEINSANPSIRSMYMRYAVFLFAVPALCNILHFSSYSIPGSMIYGVFMFAASLGLAYAFGFIMQILAIKFDGQCPLEKGVALAIFSATPQFIAPVIALLPGAIFSLISLVVSLYGLRLFYLGVGELTSVPQENRMKFILSFFGCAIVCGIILGALSTPLSPVPDVITSMPFQ